MVALQPRPAELRLDAKQDVPGLEIVADLAAGQRSLAVVRASLVRPQRQATEPVEDAKVIERRGAECARLFPLLAAPGATKMGTDIEAGPAVGCNNRRRRLVSRTRRKVRRQSGTSSDNCNSGRREKRSSKTTHG